MMKLKYSSALTGLLIVGSTLSACASSDNNADAQISKSVDGTDVTIDGTRVTDAQRLYFDAPETFFATTENKTFTFQGRGDAPLHVEVSGQDAALRARLYSRTAEDTRWREIGVGENPNRIILEDNVGESRTYLLEITAAVEKTVVVALKCNAGTHEACAATQQPDDVCSGILPRALPCDEGLFCNFIRNTCGYADQGGRCLKTPTICIKIYKPVCGCDGKTYPNECDAATVGASIARDGECGNK